jgi:hypothetical protein
LRKIFQNDKASNVDEIKISDEQSVAAWLSDKPISWGQVLALRAALRALPYLAHSGQNWLEAFALLPLGALFTSWTQLVYPSVFVRNDESRANNRFNGEAFDFEFYRSQMIATSASEAGYHSADAQSRSMHWISDCTKAIAQAEKAFQADMKQKFGPELGSSVGVSIFWESISSDCKWLLDTSVAGAAGPLASQPLWHESFPYWTQNLSPKLQRKLVSVDPNFSFWLDWYERRVRGARHAFDIPGDKNGNEEKEILRRLCEAANEGFWDKGHGYVNAELTRWLEDARERAARNLQDGDPPIETPPQVFGATAYGINAEGKIDRLPHADQSRLLDTPSQRRAYADLRDAAIELQQEGQRLGSKLNKGLDRINTSLPEQFEEAEVDLVWRDGNALRRLYYAHRKVESSPEPDPAKLEPAIAEGLGGLLDLFNNFAFADAGLRAKDERRIPPQERADAEREAQAAAPVFAAVSAAPEIVSETAMADLSSELEDADLPQDEAYASQALDQSNRTKRNFFAPALAWAAKTLSSPKQVGKAVALGIVGGAAGAVGKVAMTAILATPLAPMLEFLATNAAILTNYVTVAYPAYPHLPELIEQARQLWLRLKGP